jgi:DNA-binding transcriptional MerR regulator
LRIGELAAMCGVSTRTVDYYTRLGLLEPATRTDGNYRLYGPEAVCRLQQVKCLQEERLSLHEIRQALSNGGELPEVAVLEQVRRDLEAMHRRLASVGAAGIGGSDGAVSDAAHTALERARTVALCLQQLVGGAGPPP